MDTIGSRMKYIRKAAGLKQAEFASRVLVSASYISKVESGKELPSEVFTKLVALEFGVSYIWLKEGIGDAQINQKEHDYFERNIVINDISEDIVELNKNFRILLDDNNTFRKMCISEISRSLSKIMQMAVSNNEEIILVELLADYLGNMEELIEKLNRIKGANDYSVTSNHYISSFTKDIKKIFCELSDLIAKSKK